jgi:flagellar FliL protein
MADKENGTLEEAVALDAKKGLPMKLILVAVVLVVVLVAGILVLKSGLLSGSSEGKEDAEKKAQAILAATDIGPIYTLETFIVNLADPRGKKYLKTKLELELNNPLVVQEIDQRLPQFRDTVLTILSSKTFEDVRQLEGKYQLRAEIMTMLNQFLKTGEITNIYFTEFIVQ